MGLRLLRGALAGFVRALGVGVGAAPSATAA